MSGNQPPGGQPGPYGNQPSEPNYQGPSYQGPSYQGPQYQGPGFGGPQQPGQQGQPGQQPGQQGYPQYQGPGGPGSGSPVGSPGTPSYTGAYGAPTSGQPGQPPSGPQQPYGFAPGAPGQPPQSGNSKKVLIIVGAVVLALIIGGIGLGVALSRRTPTTTTDPGGVPQTQPSNGPASQLPAAAKQSDAARVYLEALATGKSESVIATLDRVPVDKTFLTDAVLAQSAKLAPLTDIQVSEPDSEYSSTVDASYKLGDTPVSTSIRVVKQGDGWKVREGYNELDLGSRRSRTLPMLINGVAVTTAKVRLFPGAYQFTTGAKYITYGDESTLTVESATDYPRGLSDIQATLTDAGEKAFISEVKSSVNACLKSKDLKNANCPNNVTKVSGGFKPKDGTVKWSLRGGSDPFSNMRVRLDYENPAVAQASVYLSLRGESSDCGSGRACTITPYFSPNPQADMTKDKIAIAWVRR